MKNMLAKSKRGIVALIGAIILGGVAEASAAATLRIDNANLEVGDQVSLQIIISNAEPTAIPSLKLPDGAAQVYGPNRENRVQIIGRKRSSTTIYTYGVAFLKAGRVQISPVAIQTNMGRLATNVLMVNVRKTSKTSWMFAEATIEPKDAYIGHAITATFKFGFQTGRNIVGVNIAIPFFKKNPNLRIVDANESEKKWQSYFEKHRRTPSNLQELNIEDVGKMIAEVGTEIRQGVRYSTYTIRRLLIPQEEGAYKFDAPWVMLQSRKPRTNRRRASGLENRMATTNSFALNVIPTPSQNRPADFEGTIGSYSMTSHLSAHKVAFGEPIALEIVVRGEGNLETISVPKLIDDTNFRVGTVEQEKNERFINGRYGGEKKFTITLRPRQPDLKQVSGVKLVTFDVKSGNYITLTTQPMPIEIELAENLGAFNSVHLDSERANNEPQELGRDLEDIKTDYDAKDATGLLHSAGGVFWGLVLPFILFAGSIPILKRAQKLRTDSNYARRTFALKVALKALSALEEAGHAQGGLLAEELGRIVQNYISDRLGRAQGELTATEARVLVLSSGGAESNNALAQKAETILRAAEDARYGGGVLDVNRAITEVREFLEEFEGGEL